MTLAEIFPTPDEANLPLFLHILGAMALIGALLLAATALSPGRDGSVRLGFRSLLFAALPSYLVMRIAAQWVADEEGLADSEAAWITIGYITSEFGLLLMIAATVCAGISNRRGGRPGLTRAAFFLTAFLIAMYVVTIWAMTTKPE